MNDPNSQNNQNLNNQPNSQVDPNFLPKDSNVYIRTMKTDLNNLKEKGGENLPYIEKPANVNDFSNTLQNGQNNTPVNLQESDAITNENKKDDNIFGNQDFNTPTPDQNPQMPETPNVKQPENTEQNVFDNQQFGVPGNENAGSVNNIKDKIKELNTNPNAKPIDSRPGNWSEDPSNQDLSNLITPEEFNPMSNININESQPKKKNKLTLIISLLIVIIGIVLLFVFVIRPRMISPNVSLKTTSGGDMLSNSPTSAPVTTKASPFIALKNGFQLNNLNIDISKSPEIVDQIKKEGGNLLPPGTFKVIVPKIKDQYLNSTDISRAFIDNAPLSFTNNLENKYIIYGFYGEIHPSLGIVFQVKNDSIEQIKAEFRN
jgi:hypothetical protein